LKADSESLPMTDAGSEFQTDGAAHRKERYGIDRQTTDSATN